MLAIFQQEVNKQFLPNSIADHLLVEDLHFSNYSFIWNHKCIKCGQNFINVIAKRYNNCNTSKNENFFVKSRQWLQIFCLYSTFTFKSFYNDVKGTYMASDYFLSLLNFICHNAARNILFQSKYISQLVILVEF